MVSDEIIKVLDNLCEKFGLAIDWSGQNILPYAQELIQRIANLQLAYGIIWVIAGIASIFLTAFCVKQYKKSVGDDYDLDVLWLVAIIVLCLFSLMAFIFGFSIIPKAIFLPELTAIEYIQNLI